MWQTYRAPNNFTNHTAFQESYRPIDWQKSFRSEITPADFKTVLQIPREAVSPFAAPPENLTIEFANITVIDDNSCSACQSTLLLFLTRYKDRPYNGEIAFCDSQVARVIAEGKRVTYDLGGTAGTSQFADAVIDRLNAA